MSVKLRLCLRVLKIYPQRCWLLLVSTGSKKSTRDVSEVAAVFMGSKIYPQQCWLLLVSAGLKKYTRDVSEVTAVFAGSKECIREGVCCSLCLWVQKNAPAMVLGRFSSSGFKKMYP